MAVNSPKPSTTPDPTAGYILFLRNLDRAMIRLTRREPATCTGAELWAWYQEGRDYWDIAGELVRRNFEREAPK